MNSELLISDWFVLTGGMGIDRLGGLVPVYFKKVERVIPTERAARVSGGISLRGYGAVLIRVPQNSAHY